MDETRIEQAVKATREYNATEAGKAGWMSRRRAGLNDTQNWAVSVAMASDQVCTGEEIGDIVAALEGHRRF